ncbi:hypothetical protein C9374_007167 [Naegleria lovaniensis]|uniref:Uncharacterized protein n=1 Tax=Naegleria lovaniensis TaxID=51637 RepID=A0AA88KRX1_NAELO|nr:uncharacterized protein C9374_007167 [Naegleria lovaniensis]KAG2393636.1 hypothetical protein C9374_007167 [Naegleria lovaniensis]
MEDFVISNLVPLIEETKLKINGCCQDDERHQQFKTLENSILSFTNKFIDLQIPIVQSLQNLIESINHSSSTHSNHTTATVIPSSSIEPSSNVSLQQVSVLETLHHCCEILMLRVRKEDFWQNHDDNGKTMSNTQIQSCLLNTIHMENNPNSNETSEQTHFSSPLEISNQDISSSLIIIDTCLLYFILQLLLNHTSPKQQTKSTESSKTNAKTLDSNIQRLKQLLTGKYLQFALLTFLKFKFLNKLRSLGEEQTIELFNMNELDSEIVEKLTVATKSNHDTQQVKICLNKPIHICELIFQLLLVIPIHLKEEEDIFNTMLKYSPTCHADLAVWYSISKFQKYSHEKQMSQIQNSQNSITFPSILLKLKEKLSSFNLRHCMKLVRGTLFDKQDEIKKELLLRWISACTILHTLSNTQGTDSKHFTEISKHYFSNVIENGHELLKYPSSYPSHSFHYLFHGILNALRNYIIAQTGAGSKYALIDRAQFFSNIDKYILDNDKMSSCENFRTYLAILMKLYFTTSSFSSYQRLNGALLKLLQMVNTTNDMIRILTITECEQNRTIDQNNAFFTVRNSIVFQLVSNSTEINKLVSDSIDEARQYEINGKPCVQRYKHVSENMIANSKQLFTHVLKSFVTQYHYVFPTSLREIFATIACVKLDFKHTITPQSMATLICDHSFALFYVFEGYRIMCSSVTYKYLSQLTDYCIAYMQHDDMSFIEQSKDEHGLLKPIPTFSSFVRELCYLNSIFVNTYGKHFHERKSLICGVMERIVKEGGSPYFDVEVITVC